MNAKPIDRVGGPPLASSAASAHRSATHDPRRFRAAVVGASGYAGGEVARLLTHHPHIEAATLCAHSQAGVSIAQALPFLHSDPQQIFHEAHPALLAQHDLVFLGIPHGHSAAIAREIQAINPDVILIDLGADFRLERAEDWQAYYAGEHAGTWTYGMPELPRHQGPSQRERLVSSRTIAVPGCNATAVSLGAIPLIFSGAAQAHTLHTVLSVGYSGAGKAAKTHLQFSEAQGGAVAYSAGGTHRHIPEILQNISHATGFTRERLALSFTPILVPMSRGILAVINASIPEAMDIDDAAHAINRAFRDLYYDEPLIQILGQGAFPHTAHTTGSARVHVGWAIDPHSRTISVMSALDNLGKGTACAAIQSANLALGLDELAGVPLVGLHP